MAAISPKLDDRLRQRAGVEVRTFPGGAVLVNMATGRCFRLNRVGAVVWKMLETPRRCSELYADVASRYSVPANQVQLDVGDLVRSLLQEDLVEVQEAP